jgi:hypothetical protein
MRLAPEPAQHRKTVQERTLIHTAHVPKRTPQHLRRAEIGFGHMATCANCGRRSGFCGRRPAAGYARTTSARPRNKIVRAVGVRDNCVAKQKGGVYTVESGWRLPSERDVAARPDTRRGRGTSL